MIAAIPSLDQPARNLAEGYGMQVVEAGSASDLIEEIRTRLEGMLQKPEVVRSTPPETY